VLKVIFNSHIMNHAQQRSSFRSICCSMLLLPNVCVYACVEESLCVILYIVFIVPKHGECSVEVDVCQEGPKIL